MLHCFWNASYHIITYDIRIQTIEAMFDLCAYWPIGQRSTIRCCASVSGKDPYARGVVPAHSLRMVSSADEESLTQKSSTSFQIAGSYSTPNPGPVGTATAPLSMAKSGVYHGSGAQVAL